MFSKIDKRIFQWEPAFKRSVVRLAWPIMLQNLVMAFMFIVDNLMIGQLGQHALAGATQANRITFLMQVTMFGVVSGASVLTAQYWGTKDMKGIHKTLGLGLVMAAVVALLFAIPSMVIPDKIIGLLLSNPDAAEARVAGAEYLRVIGVAYFFQAMSMVQSAVLKSTEQVRLPMFGSIVAIVVNVLFNYLLIFGNLGFPELGVSGGAIATAIGCAVEFCLLIVAGYALKLPNAAKLKAMRSNSRADVRRFFAVVLPTMANEGFWALGMVVYSFAYGRMGADVVAADSIFRNVEQFAVVALRGATHACAVLIGMDIGAGREKDAQMTAKRMLVLGVGLGLLVGAIVAVIGPFIVRSFPVTPEVAASARALINIFACCFFAQSSACLLIVGIFRAGGDVRYAMLADIVPMWVTSIPLVLITGPGLNWPIQYVYLLSRVDEVIKSIIGLRRLGSGKWINNLVREPAARDDQLPGDCAQIAEV